jgi:hypothetical protein
MAQQRLSGLQQQTGAAPQQGLGGEPQQGPVPGWAAEPQAGAPGGGGAGGWQGPGWQNQGWQGGRSTARDALGDGLPIGDDIAGLAMNVAGRFLGRAISKRVQKTMTERVMPAMSAKGDAMLRQQIAIAERHPDLCACMADKVVFVAGGSRVVPMKEVNFATMTPEQSDELVARLRG